MVESVFPDWDRIIERHAKRVFRVALRILGSVPDAEDVSQDVFTEAFRLHSAGPVQSWTADGKALATVIGFEMRFAMQLPAKSRGNGPRTSRFRPWCSHPMAKPWQQASPNGDNLVETAENNPVVSSFGMSNEPAYCEPSPTTSRSRSSPIPAMASTWRPRRTRDR